MSLRNFLQVYTILLIFSILIIGTFSDCNGGKLCGESRPHSRRILNGEVINDKTYPWLILVRVREPFVICGGVIITPLHVLTVARCVVDEDDYLRLLQVKITILSYDLCNKGESGSIHSRAAKIVPHEKFHHHNNVYYNDIAIITLEERVDVPAVCLPCEEITFETKMTAVGMGSNHPLGPDENNCRITSAEFETIFDDWCVDTNTICALGSGTICKEDFGGALFTYNEYNHSVLRGLMSYGSSNCTPHTAYQVFTNVYRFMPWITDKIESTNIG